VLHHGDLVLRPHVVVGGPHARDVHADLRRKDTVRGRETVSGRWPQCGDAACSPCGGRTRS
jgi:hypothetical protein